MAPRRADREPWSMTPSRMMTRQKVHPQARACLAAALAVACLTTVPRPTHADPEVFAVARGLLGQAEDPLREAKEVLGRPSPPSSDLRA
jgi:hypothetical protein